MKRSKHGMTPCPACGVQVHTAATPAATWCPQCMEPLTTARRGRQHEGRGGVVMASLLAASSATACENPLQEDPPPRSQETISDRPPQEPTRRGEPWEPSEAEEDVMVEAYGAPPDEVDEEPKRQPPTRSEADIGEAEPPAPAPAYGLPPQEDGPGE